MSGTALRSYPNTGNYNTATGASTLNDNGNGSYNTATGAFALFYPTNSNNTATGAYALLGTIGVSTTLAMEAIRPPMDFPLSRTTFPAMGIRRAAFRLS